MPREDRRIIRTTTAEDRAQRDAELAQRGMERDAWRASRSTLARYGNARSDRRPAGFRSSYN